MLHLKCNRNGITTEIIIHDNGLLFCSDKELRGDDSSPLLGRVPVSECRKCPFFKGIIGTGFDRGYKDDDKPSFQAKKNIIEQANQEENERDKKWRLDEGRI